MAAPSNQHHQTMDSHSTLTLAETSAAGYRSSFEPTASFLMCWLSIFHIVIGILSVVAGTVLLIDPYVNIGYGIWDGVYFIVIGGIGLGASQKNMKIWIIATMVLNIISAAIFCPILLLLISLYYGGAMSIALLLFAILELAISVCSAAFCLDAVCRCNRTVHYNITPR